MALPLYLAQTPLEMAGNSPPGRLAWMACHFSPGGQGLSNQPDSLPCGTMLILDDSTPMDGHDPELILDQLSQLISCHGCESLLLDFQRQGIPGQQELAKLLVKALPCPVGVSELYAGELPCPVFLPPVPPDKLLSEHLAPWQSREVWLEAALEGITLTLTEEGCTVESLCQFPEDGLADSNFHCHYTIETASEFAVFHLRRSRADLEDLLSEAASMGVSRAVGLWQELGK